MAIGAILILLTTAVHAGGMHLALRSIRLQVTSVGSRLHLNRVLRVGRAVLIMYFVAIVEVLIWGAAYLALGSVEGFEKAIYFSAVTFTTLGYSDVVLDSSRRLLASLKAVNGILVLAGRLRLSYTPCNAFIPAGKPTDMIDMSRAHGGNNEIKAPVPMNWIDNQRLLLYGKPLIFDFINRNLKESLIAKGVT